MKIFIVEDEKFLRNYMERFLKLKGYQVISFQDAESFFNEAIPNKDDCVILDINLPGKNGFDIIDQLNARNCGIHVIFISALKDVEQIVRAFKSGGSDYIKKPFELEELLVRIERLCLPSSPTKHIKICKKYFYNTNTRQLENNSQPIYLPSIQSQLLELFINNNNLLLTFDYLLNTIWWERSISHSTVSSHIQRLKKNIPCLNIKNIRGEGYMIMLESE